MTSTAALSEREKKKMHERHEKILEELMQDESNRFCADCSQKGVCVYLCIFVYISVCCLFENLTLIWV